MKPVFSLRNHRHARGFSLIELMVGIAVGMIGLLVIYKTLSIWDGHARTTSAGGDAQVAGTLAMFNIERDIKLAGQGFGMAAGTVMGCTVTGTDTQTGRALTFPLYPVQIAASGAAGAPDSINVLSGSSSYFVTTQTFNTSSPTTKKLARRNGFRNGDLAIVAGNATSAMGSANCQLVQITNTADTDGFTVGHANTTYTPDAAYAASGAASSVASRYNAAGGTGGTFTSGTIYSLGPQPQLNRWSSDGRVLSRVGYLNSATPLEISEGVINMKAQYGVDTDNDNIISSTAAEWTTTTPTDWTKVRAIRVALLVRSGQFEKPAGSTNVPVTSVNPNWVKGDGSTEDFLMTNVDGTSDSYGPTDAVPNNWRYYRYNVYEKVIPLRNMIWGTAP